MKRSKHNKRSKIRQKEKDDKQLIREIMNDCQELMDALKDCDYSY